MQYLAKIIGEQRERNLWKYDFIDLNTGNEISFYHGQKLNYISIFAGRLELFLDEEKEVNLWQSFEQDINSYIEGSKAENLLTQIWGKSNQVIEKLESEKIKFSPQQITELEERGLTHKEIAKVARVCERTIRYWKNPTNEPKKQVGRPRMMNKDIRASLYLDFLTDNTKTQQARANSIYQEKGIKVSQQVISYNVKKDIGFTRKKGAKRYSGLKMEKVRQFLGENGWLYSLPNCLAMDEFPTHLGEAPQYAWSRKGCSAEIIQIGQKIATYTVMVCIQNINKQGVIRCKVIKNKKKIKDKKTGKVRIKKGTDALDFYNYLKKIKLPTSEEYYLLLDNASIHSTTDKLIEWGLSIEELASQKNIVLVYLPKYAPQINPVELCNNFIIGSIRSEQPETEKELKRVIKEAVAFLNQKDLTKWFRHCRDYFGINKNGK